MQLSLLLPLAFILGCSSVSVGSGERSALTTDAGAFDADGGTRDALAAVETDADADAEGGNVVGHVSDAGEMDARADGDGAVDLSQLCLPMTEDFTLYDEERNVYRTTTVRDVRVTCDAEMQDLWRCAGDCPEECIDWGNTVCCCPGVTDASF